MSDKVFLDKIEFNKDFLPFKEGDKIFFGGEKQVQDLVRFYLKSKGVKNYENNAERFKINCVLGNNGGGKSRLFEGIIKDDSLNLFIKVNDTSFIKEEGYNFEIFNIGFICGNTETYFLLDDISLFSRLKNYKYNTSSVFLSKFKQKSKIDLYNFSFEYKNIIASFFKKLVVPEIIIKPNYKYDGFNNYIESILEDKEDISTEGFFKEINLDIRAFSIYYKKLLGKKEKKLLIPFFYIFLILGRYYWKKVSQHSKDRKEHVYFLKNNLDNLEEYFSLEGFDNFFDWIDDFLKLLDILDDEINEKYKENLKKNLYYLSEIYKKREVNDIDILNKLHWYENHGKNIIYRIFYEDLEKGKDLLNWKDLENGKDLLDNLGHYMYHLFDKFPFGKYPYLDEYIFTESFSDKKVDNIIYSSLLFDSTFYINEKLNYDKLSSGEKIILLRLTSIINNIFENYSKNIENFIILIDEPDLHLHLEWQKKYIQKLIDVFSNLPKDIKLHFIIATHSPFIISDLPNEAIVVLDGKGEYTKILTYDKEGNQKEHKEFKDIQEYNKYVKSSKNKTFGANFVDLIRDGFFFEDKILMGSFAEEIIGDIADLERRLICVNSIDGKVEKLNSSEKERIEKIKSQIGDSFLRDNLLYFKKRKND